MSAEVTVPDVYEIQFDRDTAIWREKMILERRLEASEARVRELEGALAESQRLVGIADERIERLGRLLAEARAESAERTEEPPKEETPPASTTLSGHAKLIPTREEGS